MKHALTAFVVLLPACATGASPAVVNPLVGAWRLEQYVDKPEGGAPVYAFGNPPAGLFVFTADGHVSISLMRNPPNPAETVADPDPDACVPGWYCSYFGTYTYDTSGPRWVAHVTGGNIPSYIGTDQARSFAIDGDTLTILETYEAGGATYHAKRVLRRTSR